jgi:hypothetical protein
MEILIGAILTVMVAFAQPAAAGPWHDLTGGMFTVQAQRQPPGGFQRQPQPQPQPQRDFRGPDRPPEPGPRSDGRLTEDERRALRRDIDRANREIYKGRP